MPDNFPGSTLFTEIYLMYVSFQIVANFPVDHYIFRIDIFHRTADIRIKDLIATCLTGLGADAHKKCHRPSVSVNAEIDISE